MKSKSVLLMMFALLTADLGAAGPGAGSSSCFFRTVGLGVQLSDVLYQDGKEFKPLSVEDERRSKFFPVAAGTSELVLARMVENAEGKSVPAEIQRVALDPSSRRSLLIFSKKGDTGQGWNVLSLPDNATNVPPGGYRFVNFLDIPAGIILGEKSVILKPGESTISEVRPAGDQVVFKVQVYQIPKGNPTAVYSNIWAFDPAKRHLVIIAPSTETASKVEVKRLSEYSNAIPEEGVTPAPANAKAP